MGKNVRKITVYSKKYGKKTVLVDSEDYPRLMKITWTLQYHNKCGIGRFIVCGWIKDHTEKLHRYILNIPYKSKIRTVHLDGDNFNNQKSNLKAIRKCVFRKLSDRIEMTLRSHSFGEHKFYFDNEFYITFSELTWRVVKGHDTFYAATIGENNKVMFMHQLVVPNPKGEVDHIDRNGHNNVSANLRMASKSQNKCNSKFRKDNTTGFRGVFLHSNIDKYFVALTVHKKRYYGGIFGSKIQAAKKYNELAIKLHGEFAHLNKIPK